MPASRLHKDKDYGLRLDGAAWMAAVLILLAGCARHDPAPPLVIGINSWPGYEFARLAREKGFYDAEGVDVKLVEFPSLSDVRRAYERGQLDGMFSTVVEVLQARQLPERKPVITLVTDYSDGADVVLAQQEIGDLAGLRGRRVGLELGSLNTYLLARALDRAGMGLKDVTLVNLSQTELAAALDRHEVDAVVSYPPESLDLEKRFRLRRLFSSAQIPGEVPDVLSFEAEVLAARAADVVAVLRAYGRAQRFAREQPGQAHAIMAAQEGIPIESFTGALESGIKLVEVHAQAPFFAPQSPLRTAVQITAKVLLDTRQLAVPITTAGVVRESSPL